MLEGLRQKRSQPWREPALDRGAINDKHILDSSTAGFEIEAVDAALMKPRTLRGSCLGRAERCRPVAWPEAGVLKLQYCSIFVSRWFSCNFVAGVLVGEAAFGLVRLPEIVRDPMAHMFPRNGHQRVVDRLAIQPTHSPANTQQQAREAPGLMLPAQRFQLPKCRFQNFAGRTELHRGTPVTWMKSSSCDRTTCSNA